jgi:hypothetical protein
MASPGAASSYTWSDFFANVKNVKNRKTCIELMNRSNVKIEDFLKLETIAKHQKLASILDKHCNDQVVRCISLSEQVPQSQPSLVRANGRTFVKAEYKKLVAIS